MSSIINLPIIHNDLKQFGKFVRDTTDVDQTAKMGGYGKVKDADNAAGWLKRHINCRAGKDAVNDNNYVRETFLNALKNQFGVKSAYDLPASIRSALRGTHARGDLDDFGIKREEDGSEKVTSGKPLTQRRISAVLKAVESELRDSNTIKGIINAKRKELNENLGVLNKLKDEGRLSEDEGTPGDMNAMYIAAQAKEKKSSLTDEINNYRNYLNDLP